MGSRRSCCGAIRDWRSPAVRGCSPADASIPSDYPGGAAPRRVVSATLPDDDPLVLTAARNAAVRETHEEADLSIDGDDLVWFAHWTPAPGAPIRFATWFFMTRAPEGAVTVDDGEIHEHIWIRPAEAIRRRDLGEIEIIPPTWVTLFMLTELTDVDAALTLARSRPPEYYQSRIAPDRGRHGRVSGRATPPTTTVISVEPGPRHRLLMLEDGWRLEHDSEPYAGRGGARAPGKGPRSVLPTPVTAGCRRALLRSARVTSAPPYSSLVRQPEPVLGPPRRRDRDGTRAPRGCLQQRRRIRPGPDAHDRGGQCTTPPTTAPAKINTIPGMPPVTNPSNLYSDAGAGMLSPAVKGALTRVYVPNRGSNNVSVIDPTTMKVVDTFSVGLNPQHIVPSWDLKTLWVTNNAEGTHRRLAHADRSRRRASPARRHRRRPLQHVLHARRQVRDQRRRSPQAARLPRPAHDGGRELARRARLRRRQPRRLHDRRPLRHLHLRVPGQPREDRRGEPHGRRVPPPEPRRHAARHPQLTRRQHVLRRRDDARRRLHDRPEHVHRDRLHRHWHRHTRPVPEPRRHQAVRGQSGQLTSRGSAQWAGQHLGDRLRHEDRSPRTGRSPVGAAPTWATSASTARRSG